MFTEFDDESIPHSHDPLYEEKGKIRKYCQYLNALSSYDRNNYTPGEVLEEIHRMYFQYRHSRRAQEELGQALVDAGFPS